MLVTRTLSRQGGINTVRKSKMVIQAKVSSEYFKEDVYRGYGVSEGSGVMAF